MKLFKIMFCVVIVMLLFSVTVCAESYTTYPGGATYNYDEAGNVTIDGGIIDKATIFVK